MTRVRERLFAGFGAFLFLASACTLTIFVIFQSDSSNTTNTTASQQQKCADSQSEPTLPAPEAYTPTVPVASLQTTDLAQGNGPAAQDGDCLVVKYYGTLASNGTKFDENFSQASAFAFTLGQGQVIEGWDKGMVGMKVGATRRLTIPAAQAYGSQSPSSAIPANSDLVFVVKLLRIQK